MLNKDRTLVSESGRAYRVCALISTGTGQGDIYRVTDGEAAYALKLFHGEDRDRMRGQIEALLRRGKACPAFVHPLDIVSCEGRIGYVMEYVPDSFLPGSALYNGVEREGYREELPFHQRLSVLYNIAEALSVSYKANLAMMDLKFDNLKFDPETCAVRIMDTDTMVGADGGKGFIEGTVGFMPPLTMQRLEKPGKHNDSFALAVMIFMTLIGAHPLMGRAENTVRDRDIETYLLADHPVYIWHPTDVTNRPTPEQAMAESRLCRYPDYFLQAMERTFVEGIFQGERRVTPAEWCEILQRLYADSFCCRECGEEQFFTSPKQYCDVCDSPLVRPLLIKGDRAVPLFLSATLTERELWEDTPRDRPVCRVTTTAYKGKYGLLIEAERCVLALPEGKRITFGRGKVVPLFLNGVYEIENKKFVITEGI